MASKLKLILRDIDKARSYRMLFETTSFTNEEMVSILELAVCEIAKLTGLVPHSVAIFGDFSFLVYRQAVDTREVCTLRVSPRRLILRKALTSIKEYSLVPSSVALSVAISEIAKSLNDLVSENAPCAS